MGKYSYINRNNFGIVKEAQVYPTIERRTNLPFVSLEFLEDYRYRVFAGTENSIDHNFYFPFTSAGLVEALKKFDEFVTPDMPIRINHVSSEETRVAKYEGKANPKKELVKLNKLKEKRHLQLKDVLSKLLELDILTLDELISIYKSLK